jgi:hypothetical protein
VTLRSLNTRLRRLASSSGERRCAACGGFLPPDLLRPRPISMHDEYGLPEVVEALLPLATPDEARELQALLNRCIELRPDLAVLREQSYPIWGAPPSPDAGDQTLRFRFADPGDPGPCCPQCGAAVVVEPSSGGRSPRVCAMIFLCPAPDGLLDALRLDPVSAARFAELEATLHQRAGACSAANRDAHGRHVTPQAF